MVIKLIVCSRVLSVKRFYAILIISPGSLGTKFPGAIQISSKSKLVTSLNSPTQPFRWTKDKRVICTAKSDTVYPSERGFLQIPLCESPCTICAVADMQVSFQSLVQENLHNSSRKSTAIPVSISATRRKSVCGRTRPYEDSLLNSRLSYLHRNHDCRKFRVPCLTEFVAENWPTFASIRFLEGHVVGDLRPVHGRSTSIAGNSSSNGENEKSFANSSFRSMTV